MPHLLTDDQLERIKRIIEKHHVALIAQVVGLDALSDDELKVLEESDLTLEDLEAFKDAYLHGQAVAQNSSVPSMPLAQFKTWLQKNPIPLSQPEQMAIEATNHRVGQHIRNLGAKITLQVNTATLEQDEQVRTELLEGVRDETKENIKKRQSVGKLKSQLGHLTGDWTRDWMRVAITEKHTAMQQGVADSYAKTHGRACRVVVLKF